MRNLICVLFIGVAILSACNGNQPATGKGPYDSLFLGFYFGMERKDFFDLCWEMNRQKKFTHGPTNQKVEYILKDELDHPVYMRFYPYFYKDKIYQMPVTFTYEAWAPWNKDYSSNVLIEKLVPLMKKWYNVEFETTTHPEVGKAYAAVTGNRRISVFVKDDQFVQVVLTDIPAEKLIKKEFMDSQKDNPI
jgi:hypothetical protein